MHDRIAVTHYHYKLFGLVFKSEIEIKGLLPAIENQSDVIIRYGYVPDSLKNASGKWKNFESDRNDFLFRIDGIAKFRVQNGKKITVHPWNDLAPDKISIALLGIIFSGLFIQRGLIPIHGSAVVKENESIIFSGDSHVGKSSVAFALSKRGYSVIADDLAVINSHNSDNLLVYPGVPFLKLWKDVLDHFNLDENLQKIRPDIKKYIKHINPHINPDPVKFDRIVILNKTNRPDFSAQEITGFEKYNLLMNHGFRIHYLDDHELIQDYFNSLSNLANGTRVFNIGRPESSMQITELADFIIENI